MTRYYRSPAKIFTTLRIAERSNVEEVWLPIDKNSSISYIYDLVKTRYPKTKLRRKGGVIWLIVSFRKD